MVLTQIEQLQLIQEQSEDHRKLRSTAPFPKAKCHSNDHHFTLATINTTTEWPTLLGKSDQCENRQNKQRRFEAGEKSEVEAEKVSVGKG